MTSLAARDQENLVNAHQQAAASKPLNQGTRALHPKTPGNKTLQTPYKGRLNDENANFATKGNKIAVKENIQLDIGKGKQAAAPTPVPQTQARNALAPKTTNAKAKAAQTSGKLEIKKDATLRSNQRPASLRRSKQKLNLHQDVKLQIPADLDDDDDVVPDIGIIHPAPPDLPDIDEQTPILDLTPLHETPLEDFPRLFLSHRLNEKGDDGLTNLERQGKEEEEMQRVLRARVMATAEKESQLSLLDLTCACPDEEGECQGPCKMFDGERAKIEAKFAETMATLVTPWERREKDVREAVEGLKQVPAKAKAEAAKKVKRREQERVPSETASKRAASALSMQPKEPRHVANPSRDYAKPWLANSKRTDLEGHAGRHATAVAASKTTLGFQKGRSASANMRATVLSQGQGGQAQKPSAPKRKSDAQLLSEMWSDLGHEEDADKKDNWAEDGAGDTDMLDVEAAEDFVFKL